MPLEVISRVSFGFGVISEKNHKKGKPKKSGKNGFLRRIVGNPRRSVDLHYNVGYPRRGEAKVPKWHPLGYATA